MCTVTFIPSGNKFFFTSSRDEKADRPMADFPQEHILNGQTLIYPRDSQAGGSWIAVHESGNTAVLLNGAMTPHQRNPSYKKSRGLVLLDLIARSSPADAFEEYDFRGIEPFTVILLDNHQLYSGKWDGRMKWMEFHNANKARIWSSVTLYDEPAIRKRESWFSQWLLENPYPGSLDIIHFHQKGGDGDPFNDILMNRNKKLYTNSISSICLGTDNASFRYLDLRSGKSAEEFFELKKPVTVKA
jgi:Transport and Golgi organisation 2